MFCDTLHTTSYVMSYTCTCKPVLTPYIQLPMSPHTYIYGLYIFWHPTHQLPMSCHSRIHVNLFWHPTYNFLRHIIHTYTDYACSDTLHTNFLRDVVHIYIFTYSDTLHTNFLCHIIHTYTNYTYSDILLPTTYHIHINLHLFRYPTHQFPMPHHANIYRLYIFWHPTHQLPTTYHTHT